MNRPAVVLLDKDGVLIDLHARWGPVAAARSRLLAACIPGLEASRVAGWLGLGPDGRLSAGPMAHLGREAIARELQLWLERHLPDPIDWEPFIQEAFRRADGHAGPAVARPGVLTRLNAWKAVGTRLVVVTSDGTARAREDLEQVGILPLLDGVLGSDRVIRGKPFPDLAVAGASLAAVPCEDAWLVGDTREDLLMGREAGVGRVIGMTGGACTRDELAPWADRVVDGWDDPDLS
ncbi:MAG: HAD family hydrolase [bacterium]|nr:HAD family hydrolase [bacterium]